MRELTFEQITEGQVPDTSEECFALAAAALVQAERMVGEREPRLDLAHACTAIAFGWTALGRGLQGESQVLASAIEFEPMDMSRHQMPRPGDFGAQSLVVEPITPMFDSVSGELEAAARAHVHTELCLHLWVKTHNICDRCGESRQHHHLRCAPACPRPGPVVDYPEPQVVPALDPPVTGHLHSPACEPNCDQFPVPLEPPDHVHSPDCRHKFGVGRVSCGVCGQGPAALTWRCPVPCPIPGDVPEADPDARW